LLRVCGKANRPLRITFFIKTKRSIKQKEIVLSPRALKVTAVALIAALVLAIIALNLKLILGSTTFVEQNGNVKADSESIKQKAKEYYQRAAGAVKKAINAVAGKVRSIINFAKEHKVAAGAVLVLVVLGVAILILLRREKVNTHTAVEALRSVGLTAKSPVVIGACIIGIAAIAAAVYFIYKKKTV